MMRFMMRQKIFTFGDDFAIKNEQGLDCYKVTGKVFSFGDKLRLFDMQGNELFYIEQKLLRLLAEYHIYSGNNAVASVKRELSLFKPKFNITSVYGDYSIDGNFLGMNFRILKQGRPIAEVSKKWFSFSDSYGVDIAESEDYAFVLSLAIVLDQVLHDNNKNNH